MAGTIKVKEVIRRVSVLLQDNDQQFVRHPETELVDWLNDAQRAIFTFLPAACSRVDAVRLVPGTLQTIESIPTAYCKPGDGSTPAVPVVGSMLLDVVCNMGADGLTPGTPIRSVTDGREVLDTLVPNWHAAKDTTIINWVYDPRTPRQFYVYPGAHASTAVWVRMSFVAEPIDIPNTGTPGAELYAASGGSTTKISVHDEHVDDLVNYCCARAQMKNAQFASNTNAGAFAQMFTSSINAKSIALTGYNPNLEHLPFAPSPIGAAK
jgi:hypothetical protein